MVSLSRGLKHQDFLEKQIFLYNFTFQCFLSSKDLAFWERVNVFSQKSNLNSFVSLMDSIFMIALVFLINSVHVDNLWQRTFSFRQNYSLQKQHSNVLFQNKWRVWRVLEPTVQELMGSQESMLTEPLVHDITLFFVLRIRQCLKSYVTNAMWTKDYAKSAKSYS